MKIGFSELVVVFVVALFVIGPDKLPEYARKLGEALRQFRKASNEMTKDLRESVIEPLEEAEKKSFFQTLNIVATPSQLDDLTLYSKYEADMFDINELQEIADYISLWCSRHKDDAR